MYFACAYVILCVCVCMNVLREREGDDEEGGARQSKKEGEQKRGRREELVHRVTV